VGHPSASQSSRHPSRSRSIPHSRLRSGQNCSTGSLRGARTSTSCSANRTQNCPTQAKTRLEKAVRPCVPLGVMCSIRFGWFSRNKSSNDMAFPHPQSRNDHDRKEDIPSWRGIAWKFFKRTIDVTNDRNGKDEVNPAKNRPFGGFLHDDYDLLDSRFLTRLRRPVGRLDAELLGVLRVQSLPAVELHDISAGDAPNGLTREKAIQHIERDVPTGSTH